MTTEVVLTTTVLPGGRIEVRAPELAVGQEVTIVIRIEDDTAEKLTIEEHLKRANYRGGALFKTAEEVDAYIREERDSWDR
jgi:hypothetical protein